MSQSTDYDLAVSLRVLGVEPQEVTSSLGLTPTRTKRKGEQRIGRSGRRYADQPHHLWLMEESRAPVPELSAALAKLLKVLEPRAERLREIASRALVVDVTVGVFAPDARAGLSVEPAILLRLGRLNLSLDLDVYLSSSDADDLPT